MSPVRAETDRMSKRAWLLAALGLFGPVAQLGAAEVTGRVAMPEACSPAISPAVVRLEPLDGSPPPVPAAEAPAPALALINQRALRFDPRVVAVPAGQAVKFTNLDREPHNVHILSEGTNFNQM